jgi:hypothetical protein
MHTARATLDCLPDGFAAVADRCDQADAGDYYSVVGREI